MERSHNGFIIGWLLSGFLAGILASSMLAPQSVKSADAIKATRFELVDSAGKVRARLGFDKGRESPALIFLDTGGTEVLSLSTVDALPQLKLSGPDGKPRVLLLVTASGGPQLQMGNGTRGPNILLGAIAGDTEPTTSPPDWSLQVRGADARATLGVLSNAAGDEPILTLDPTSRSKLRVPR